MLQLSSSTSVLLSTLTLHARVIISYVYSAGCHLDLKHDSVLVEEYTCIDTIVHLKITLSDDI